MAIAGMRKDQMKNVSPQAKQTRAELKKFARLFDRKFLSGEDAKIFKDLLARIAEMAQPMDVIDWLLIKDIADITWESERLRRFIAGAIENERPEALTALITTVHEASITELETYRLAKSKALSFEMGEDKIKSAVADRMAKFGFDSESIAAEAFVRRINLVEASERMLAAAEYRRGKLLLELERRSALNCQRKKETASN